MQVGDLITWKVDVENGDKLEYGVVVGIARNIGRNVDLLWVKFLTGRHSKQKKTLCNTDHILLVKDIESKSDYF